MTGLTSNPTIFEKAIGGGTFYDQAIVDLVGQGKSGEDLFFALALQDLRQAADLFRPVHDATSGVDGWVSLEVSPLLADDTAKTIEAAKQLHAAGAAAQSVHQDSGDGGRHPGNRGGDLRGCAGQRDLAFSREHYLAAAQAYLRGIERRIAAGLDTKVESVASLFVSRWDAAVKEKLSPRFHNRFGIAIANAHLQGVPRFAGLAALAKTGEAGAHPQRLLWASTGTKDPAARDTLYIESFVAPDTINTMPEKTLLAFADHGKVGRPDGGRWR